MQAIGASFTPKAIRWLCDEVKQPPYVLAMER